MRERGSAQQIDRITSIVHKFIQKNQFKDRQNKESHNLSSCPGSKRHNLTQGPTDRQTARSIGR